MNQEKVGNFIKELRKKNNLTQKEFADKLGVTFQAVSKWENGKNIPDISTLKEISKIFNVNIDEIINGTSYQKNENKKYYIFGAVIFILVIIIGLLIILPNNNSNFKLKKISSSCDNFNVTGSAAYNKDKMSIYISNIEFCDADDYNKIYSKLECNLYETYNDTDTKISSCPSMKDITLSDYLKEIELKVDDYNSICKNSENSKLYLQINGYTENNNITTYMIPLSIDDDCNS